MPHESFKQENGGLTFVTDKPTRYITSSQNCHKTVTSSLAVVDISEQLLPAVYLWSGACIYAVTILLALVTAPWSKIRDSEALNVYLSAIVMVTTLWLLRGGIHAGLGFHLLGVTLLCLMFEWQFALFAASMIVAFTTWHGPAGWEAFGINVLLMGALPVLVTRALLYGAQRYLPHNFFIYIFVNAFLAGALAILVTGAGSAWLQHVAGVEHRDRIVEDFLQILPMLMFGEGFLNGATMALVVTYRPQWVATFHDRWYLYNK